MDTSDKIFYGLFGLCGVAVLLLIMSALIALGWNGYMEYKAYKSQPDVYIQKYTHSDSKVIDLKVKGDE